MRTRARHAPEHRANGIQALRALQERFEHAVRRDLFAAPGVVMSSRRCRS